MSHDNLTECELVAVEAGCVSAGDPAVVRSEGF